MYVISQNDLADAPDASDTGQTTLFVDDDTEQEVDEDPQRLQDKLQIRVDKVADWLSDNKMVLEPTKTKLIITMTKELRARRYPDLLITIKVGNQIVTPTPSEKLLGVVISEDMTWHPHLWGEVWRKDNNWRGVIPQLLQRLAMLRYLGRVTSQEKMKSLIPGILTSKISYALPLIGSVWGFEGYQPQEPMKLCFTKNDLQSIQSIQRQAALLMLPPPNGIDHRSTESVLKTVGWISVHQMIALSTLTLFMRIINYGIPEGILQELSVLRDTRSAKGLYRTQRHNLNISLENFMNQAVRLYNTLPANIKSMDYGDTLRCELRRWVAAKVKIKP